MFWFALFLFVVAAGAIIAAFVADDASGPALTAIIAGVVGVIFLIVSMADIVPTRNVGIVTAFNKPTGATTGAGLKWHKPWEKIDNWDASGQSYAHLGDQCVWVTIAAQRRACIPVQIEWSANPGRAPENWAAYKKVDGIEGERFGTFTERRVNPQINAAMASVFATFDPLKTVDPKSGDAPAPDLNVTYRDKIKTAVEQSLGQDIVVRSIAFEPPRYDEPTTNAINAYGQKILEARNLAVDETNAQTRARITKTDASVDQVARCLQIAEKLGKEPGLCMNPLGVLANPAK